MPRVREIRTEANGVFHGGDLAAATDHFGEPAGGWIDLSTGINPWPWRVDAGMLHGLARLPDSRDIAAVCAAAADAYGGGQGVSVVPAPGTQALIQWLPRLRSPGRVAVLSPTYGEHAASWRAAGHRVAEVADLPDAVDFDAVVLTRPNNPDGRVAARDDVLALGRALAARGGIVVADEAFADLSTEPTLADEGIVALRSFGKFYGLPGLRLGFALAEPAIATTLRDALGPWPVSSLAAEVGAAALGDIGWQERMRIRLAEAAERLDEILVAAGFEIVGGTSLYRLAGHGDAPRLFERLGRSGIYVRRFPHDPRWLRFGLPGDGDGWHRLERVLAK